MLFRLLVTALTVSALAPALHAQEFGSSPGALFVATNRASGNEIVMYNRSAKGKLTKVGNFPTGGRGEGGVNDPLQSSYSVLLSPDRTYLLVTNAGSSDISVFRILSNGLALTSVTPSGGGNPVSLAMHDDLVYVVNNGGVIHTAGFRLKASGELKPIPNSIKTLSNLDPGAGAAAFYPDGSKLVVLERLTNLIDVFTVKPDGSLSTPTFNPSQGSEPFGLQFTPTGTLLVAEAMSGSTSSYTIEANNKLTTLTSKSPASGGATCWVATNGIYAWVSNSISSSISAYSLSGGGALSPLGVAAELAATEPTIFPSLPQPTSYPLDVALSADNQFLYVFYSGNGEIVGYKVGENGKLTAIDAAYPERPQVGAEGLAAF